MTNKKIHEFLIEVPDDRMDQIREYHDLLAILDQQSFAQDGEQFFKFMSINAHQGPLTPKDPSYNGSAWNLLVNREDGSTTYEPLTVMANDAPTCALSML